MRLSAKTMVANAIRNLDKDNLTDREYDMIEWCYEAEKLIGSDDSFERRECVIPIVNYRAQLPPEIYRFHSIKIGNSYPEYTGRDFVLFHKDSPNLANRSSGNSMYNLDSEITSDMPKFYIDGSFIHITSAATELGLAYFAFPTDDEGYPLVYDKHAEAVTAYLEYKLLWPDFLNSKVPNYAFQEAKLRWLQLRNTAYAEDSTPDRKQRDRIGAIWNTFLPYPTRKTY